MRALRIPRDILTDMYTDQHLSIDKIAQQLKISNGVVWKYLVKFDIPRRRKDDYIHTKGDGNSRWKGGRSHGNQKYVRILVPGYWRADKRGYVYEHIYVWETTHNQRVPDGWLVHHLNGITYDNRPENLVAIPQERHSNMCEPFKERIRILELRIEYLEQQHGNKNTSAPGWF